jgi:hypothetical protein
MNRSRSEDLRFIQIWITPDQSQLKPQYSIKRFPWELRRNSLLKVVSGNGTDGSISINQDASILVSEIDKGKSIIHSIPRTRQGYLLCIDGIVSIDDSILNQHEAMEIVNHDQFSINAIEDCHVLMVEMRELILNLALVSG